MAQGKVLSPRTNFDQKFRYLKLHKKSRYQWKLEKTQRISLEKYVGIKL